MSRLLDYVVTIGRARLAAEDQADRLAGTIREFLKGKRGPQFNPLRAALDAYDRDFRQRPVLDTPPDEIYPSGPWQ